MEIRPLKLHFCLWFAGLVFFHFQPVCSQHPTLRFRHLSVQDGLSQSTIYSIYKDSMGFMWFGTDMGLNKYDGSKFIIYQCNSRDSLAISSNYVVAICEDYKGYLWIGNGYHGLDRFDRETETFHSYEYGHNQKGTISNNNIRAIFEDSRKNLWIGTAGGGLNLYDRETDSFTAFYYDSLNTSGIGSNFISTIVEDHDGNLWLGSPSGILTKFDPVTGKGQRFQLLDQVRSDIFIANFGRLYVDAENDIWFGTENGLFVYDQKKKTFQRFVKGNTNKNLNADIVNSVIEYSKGIYLICTDHGGLNIYNKHTGTFTYHLNSRYDESTISNNQLSTAYKSSDNIIWIGNFRGGINILDEMAEKFLHYKNLVDPAEAKNCENSVLTLCEDDEHRIWVGTDGQGIDIYDPETLKIKRIRVDKNNSNSVLSDAVTELHKDREGNIWIGTYLEGMSMYDPKTGRFKHYRHNPDNPAGIGGNNIWTILEDTDGILWIGTMGKGLNRFDRKTNTFTHYTHDPDNNSSLSNNDVMKVFQDNSGNLWVGTRNGLCLMDRKKGSFTRFISGDDRENGIYGGWINDIYQDSHDNLWIGTDQALNLYRPADMTFAHFGEKEGLIGNSILSITGDDRSNLWVSTNAGLSRFNTIEKLFRNYEIADGLQESEFNYTSVLKASDGMIYFGGTKGFNAFHPDSIADNQRIPPVYLTNLKILNIAVSPRDEGSILPSHINMAKTITLTYKQSVISVEFAALNFTNPQHNQYAYWLEGFDKNWIEIGNKHEVTYTNLNPGKYLLKVKGSNNDGIWNESGTTLEIIILPPWWRSDWFRAILYLSLIGLFLLFYFLRIAFYRKQQQKLLVLVRERTIQLEEVAAALEKKREKINTQNEELLKQKGKLERINSILVEQQNQILEQNRELDKHRNQLETLIEERTRELIQAKEKAEESDRLKSSFLANLSHEIRTPMNAILGFSSLLSERKLNAKTREQYKTIIQTSSNTLLDLINDILDISKIEAGQLKLDLREVCLEDVINDLVGIFNMFMKREDIGSDKPVALRVSMEEDIRKSQVITDKLRLEQVISNLLSNAIKFTRQGYIEIGCRKIMEASMLEFYVRDTGMGIKEQYQKLIFERFRKVEEDKSDLHRGTGLGLAISSHLVKLLGGTIYLTSTLGEGSVFYFTIPLITTNSPCTSALSNVLTDELPDFGNRHILVAEDDISNFDYIEKLLKRARAKVIHAANGKEVLEILQKEDGINLVLMDIKMPEMNGIETLKEMKKMGIGIPVIAQTAYALADEVVKLKKEGFDDYMSKPIQRDHLYAILKKYLSS